MSWFRKSTPVVEQCPVFIMNGQAIVDVFYIPMRGEPLPGSQYKNWVPDGGSEFEVTGEADRAIIESPAGCYEMVALFMAGSLLRIGEGGGGTAFIRCRRLTSDIPQLKIEGDTVSA
jgi:hypothetical protein